MSDVNNANMDGRGPRPRFDNTTGSGNRDAWNNRVVLDDNGGGNKGAGGDGSGTGSNNKQKIDDTIDDATIESIWQKYVDPNDKTLDANGNPIVNNTTTTTTTDRPDPQKQMNDYLKSVGLDPIVIDDNQKEKMAAGDFTDFVNNINSKLVNAHVKALSGSETMIQAAVEKAINKTKGEMQSSREGERNRDLLHTQMPWTKDAAISPVAQSVMQRFIDRKMSVDDAIKGTKAYFDRMNNAMNNDGVNKNRNANFSSNHRNQGSDGTPEGGWLAVLTGQGR